MNLASVALKRRVPRNEYGAANATMSSRPLSPLAFPRNRGPISQNFGGSAHDEKQVSRLKFAQSSMRVFFMPWRTSAARISRQVTRRRSWPSAFKLQSHFGKYIRAPKLFDARNSGATADVGCIELRRARLHTKLPLLMPHILRCRIFKAGARFHPRQIHRAFRPVIFSASEISGSSVSAKRMIPMKKSRKSPNPRNTPIAAVFKSVSKARN